MSYYPILHCADDQSLRTWPPYPPTNTLGSASSHIDGDLGCHLPHVDLSGSDHSYTPGTRCKADSQQGWFGLPDDSLLNHSQGLLQLWALSSPRSFRQMSGFQRTVVCTLLMPTVLTTFDRDFEQESRPANHRLDLPKPSRSFCRSEPDYVGIYQRYRCIVRRRQDCQRIAVQSW